MTPKTQSVCKHCGDEIFYDESNPNMGYWRHVESASVYCPETEAEPVAGPASTGEPQACPCPCHKGESVICNCGGGFECEYINSIPAARPSEPSAQSSQFVHMHETLCAPTGTKYVEVSPCSAPQTSAEPRPEDFRCCDNGNFGTLHDCQKSNPSAPQPVSGDAPKVEELARQLAQTTLRIKRGPNETIFDYQPRVETAIADVLRRYFPPASQTPENVQMACLEIASKMSSDVTLIQRDAEWIAKVLRKHLATPASTARTDEWVSVEKLPKPLVTEFQGRFSETLELFDDANNYWLGFYDFKDGKWWIHQGYEDDAEVLEIYKITHWRELPAAPGSVPQAEPPKEESK